MGTLGDRIRELRKRDELTQEQLSQLIHVNRATLANWEINRAIPDTLILQSIADFFRVSVDYLLGRTDDPTPPPPPGTGARQDPILAEHPWLTRLPLGMRAPAADMLRAGFLHTAVFRGGTGITWDNLDDEALRRLVAELIRFHRDSEAGEKGKKS